MKIENKFNSLLNAPHPLDAALTDGQRLDVDRVEKLTRLEYAQARDIMAEMVEEQLHVKTESFVGRPFTITLTPGDHSSKVMVGSKVEDLNVLNSTAEGNNIPYCLMVALGQWVLKYQSIKGVHPRVETVGVLEEVQPLELGVNAVRHLGRARDLLAERAATYDQPSGERSMGKTVDIFNIITGHDLTESEGWLFMQCLKQVRGFTKKEYHPDSFEDNTSYSALMAEARAAGR